MKGFQAKTKKKLYFSDLHLCEFGSEGQPCLEYQKVIKTYLPTYLATVVTVVSVVLLVTVVIVVTVVTVLTVLTVLTK